MNQKINKSFEVYNNSTPATNTLTKFPKLDNSGLRNMQAKKALENIKLNTDQPRIFTRNQKLRTKII